MERRTLLALATAQALSACANRGPRPTLTSVDIRKLGLLTVKEVPASGSIGPFNASLAGTVNFSGGKATVAPVTPATLGMGIGLALRARTDAEAASVRAAISSALQPIEFAPKQEFTKAFFEALSKRSLAMETIESESISERARGDWDFVHLPPGLDAVLDVQLDYCGYFYEKEAGGFSPSLYVSSTLLATANGGARLERYYYQADYRASANDRRFITTDPALTLQSLELARERAPAVREGMKALFAVVADRLAEDVDRSAKKLPKL